MRKIGKSKYRDWFIDRISLNDDFFTIDLSRHWVGQDENLTSSHESFRSKIVFWGVSKIIMSNFSCSAKVESIKQHESESSIFCILNCALGTFVEIVADGFSEFRL